MLPSFATETVTRIRPGVKVVRGSEVRDWNNASKLSISGCSVQPAATSLSQDGRVLGIADGWTLYAPYDADIREGDRVRYQGETYEIDGAPRKWMSATGALSNMQCALRRWAG